MKNIFNMMAQVLCSLNSEEQNIALPVHTSQDTTLLIVWRLLAYFSSSRGQEPLSIPSRLPAAQVITDALTFPLTADCGNPYV